jgi:predicted RecA/RadA family phage recombinase
MTITTDDIAEGANLYYTDTRADARITAQKGVANGLATLDGAGLIPSSQLPSFVDDVEEYADFASLPATGETGKLYITLDDNRQYRWSGSVYVQITSGAVDSVNSQTGVVVLTTTDIAEGTNLYYTEGRVSANADVVANTAKVSADSEYRQGIS